MVGYLPFSPHHLEALLDQESNAQLRGWYENGDAKNLQGETMFVNGRMMVSAGVIQAWPNRGVMWSVVSEDVRHHYPRVLKEMVKWLDRQPFDRIEISIEEKYPQALRRALILGFEIECEKARKYLPTGATCTLLARIK